MIAHTEKRRYPRTSLQLPLEYRMLNAPNAHGGLVVNASEDGLLMESTKDMSIETQLIVMVLFPKKYQLTSLEVKAEIIWKAGQIKENWQGWQYGLRFTGILDEDYQKLTYLLSGGFHLEANQVYSESPPP